MTFANSVSVKGPNIETPLYRALKPLNSKKKKKQQQIRIENENNMMRYFIDDDIWKASKDTKSV